MAFNVGTGIETDINTIYDKIKKHTASSQERVHMAPKPGEQRRSSISHAKIKKFLGWFPAVELDEGISKTVAFFKSPIIKS
jgi:UDP-glucose 4-epimerase